MDNVYTKAEVDAGLALKADKNDTYTKTQVDNKLNLKADKSDTYTKTEVNNALALKADKSDTYTKTQVDNLITGSAITNYVTTDTLQTVTGTKMFDEIHASKSYATELHVNTHKFTNVAAVSGDSSSGNNTLCTKTYIDNQINQTNPNYYPNNDFSLDTAFTAGFTRCYIKYNYLDSSNNDITAASPMDIFYYTHGGIVYISGISVINFPDASSSDTRLYIKSFDIKNNTYINYNSTSSRETGGLIIGEYWGSGSHFDFPQYYFVTMTNSGDKGLLRWMEPGNLTTANTNFIKNGYWKLHFYNYKLLHN